MKETFNIVTYRMSDNCCCSRAVTLTLWIRMAFIYRVCPFLVFFTGGSRVGKEGEVVGIWVNTMSEEGEAHPQTDFEKGYEKKRYDVFASIRNVQQQLPPL